MKDTTHPFGVTAALIFAAGLATACSEKVTPTPVLAQPAATASDTSAQTSVVGTVPAEPARDSAATQSAAQSDLSKAQQSNSMPLPGQANDHSTTAPNASQKPGDKSP